MKLVIDENIAFAEEAFSMFGDLILLPGRKITNSDLKNADILIVRSVTNVDLKLLKNTNIKFIGTATIGTDHIDKDLLKKMNITFSSAAGCNAMSVAEYVFAGIFHLTKSKSINLSNKSIGIIGVGNVGSKVEKIADSIGMQVIKNDPPRQRNEGSKEFFSLEDALNCDIISLHVPLTIGGIDNTFNLLNESNLKKIKPDSILINTSRGAVIDNKALKEKLLVCKNILTVLDVWENEPEFDEFLFSLIDIGTPHIAGYSFDGKVNGTKIIYDSLCEFLGQEKLWKPKIAEPKNNILKWDNKYTIQENLETLFPHVYNIKQDDKNFRKILTDDKITKAEYFDYLRKTYPRRREFSAYKIQGNNLPQNVYKVLKSLNIEYRI